MKNISKKFIVILVLGFILFGFNFTNVKAEEISVPLECVTPQILNEVGDACVDVAVEPILDPVLPVTLSIDTEVDVPLTCEVSDTDNVVHTYTASSPDSYLGICALKAALDLNSISNVKLSNQYPSMGLFVTIFNNTEADPNSQYWALYQNNGYTDFGISTLPIIAGDIISFKLSDFSGKETGDFVIIRVRSLIVTNTDSNQNSGSSGGGSSNPVPEKNFSVSKAFEFLNSNQKSDGSFGDAMYTDWVAIAVGAGGNTNLKSSLVSYLKLNPLDSDVVTDYERHAMALMALGINPYNGTDVNYIEKIIDSFDGIQFGDPDLINDDIFALIVLKNAGYSLDDEIINKDISYIISKQANGSWGSIDMTGAGIQSLRGFESASGVLEAISKGESYLISNQKSDGGFENNSSTSWALQVLIDTNSVSKATDYLASRQQTDGGLENVTDDIDTRVWATAYAIPAVLHKSWSSILENFSKQVVVMATINYGKEETKKEIVTPIIVKEENKDEEIIPKIEIKKVTKNLSKIKIVKNTKIEKSENESFIEDKIGGSPLSANVLGGIKSNSNNSFLSGIHNMIAKIKAPFIWLLVKLGF